MTKHSLQDFSEESTGSPTGRMAEYLKRYTNDDSSEKERRRRDYARIVDEYYDLVTDSYEERWGRQFHQACRQRGQTLQTALISHQDFLAYYLHPDKEAKVLDVGCGVAGPMSNIARLTGASITGVNINDHQAKKGQKYIREARLAQQCALTIADFLHMPFPNGVFDFAYAFEATCCAPTLLEVYLEVFRLLKPNGLFAFYEWCLTDKYDPHQPEHQQIKGAIEVSNAIPSLFPYSEVDRALKGAGFEICVTRDRALDCDPFLPWYSFLRGEDQRENSHLRHQNVSRRHPILVRAAEALIAGGRLGIFTPMYFVLVRKPV